MDDRLEFIFRLILSFLFIMGTALLGFFFVEFIIRTYFR